MPPDSYGAEKLKVPPRDAQLILGQAHMTGAILLIAPVAPNLHIRDR
jgi:hypothetical protein